MFEFFEYQTAVSFVLAHCSEQEKWTDSGFVRPMVRNAVCFDQEEISRYWFPSVGTET